MNENIKMDGNKYIPEDIEISNSEQEMTIRWADGHTSAYPLFGLRKNCPCVECRGGHGQMGSFDRELFFVDGNRTYTVKTVRQVGNHAIKIFWSDGHSNGMYQWETLRDLCPCEECYSRQQGD